MEVPSQKVKDMCEFPGTVIMMMCLFVPTQVVLYVYAKAQGLLRLLLGDTKDSRR